MMLAWRPAEMLGVSWEVAEHTLNIKLKPKPVKQALCGFNQEKRVKP
jgi:hypothetical protein